MQTLLAIIAAGVMAYGTIAIGVVHEWHPRWVIPLAAFLASIVFVLVRA